jgi:radical SAM superfamily enzyme YgiQ (UPF0313 family)
VAKRLLLINPAHMVEGRVHRGPAQFPIPPLNLGYVAALTPPAWEVRIIDENLRIEDGMSWQPDLVGLTALTPNAPRAYELAQRYRAAGVRVVIGGVHASALPDEAARYVDSVVVGDAEGVWAGLLGDFESETLKPRYMGDFGTLEGLATPRRALYPGGYFTEIAITSKGCPGHCDFCAIWRFYGQRYRVRPVDEVVDELAALSPRRLIFLADDNLTQSPHRVIELCREMVARGVRRPLAIQGALSLADHDELLVWLKRAGCVYVFVGLESLNAAALTHIGKPNLLGADAEGYRQRLANLHRHGLGVYGSFIVGLDEDTPDAFAQLERFVLETQIDCALINILAPTPGTDLWERLATEGRLLYTSFPGDYAVYSQDTVCFRPARMTPRELQEGARRLIGRLNRAPVRLHRARQTWRHTHSPLATAIALEWNRRSAIAARRPPLRSVPDMEGYLDGRDSDTYERDSGSSDHVSCRAPRTSAAFAASGEHGAGD